MSRLEELLQTLCPNGIKKFKLSTISEIKRGQRITKSELIPEGPYPVISGGVNPMGFTNDFNRNEKTITVAQYGTAGFVNWQTNKFWANDVCYTIYPDKKLINRYLYYSLLSAQDFIYTLVIDAVPAHLPQKRLAAIEIFVPPLPVQEEIVRILDTFSNVVVELEAEQAARVRQFEHYRNELLSLSNAQFQLLPVGEVCETITDYVAAGSFADLRNKVAYKSKPDFAQLVRTTDLKNNFRNNGFVYVAESAFKYLWRVNLNEDSIILPNIGNCGEVYYVLPENLPHVHNVLGPNAILVRSRKVNNKFLSYLFLTHEFQTQLMKITSPTGQTKFNKTDLKKLILPIPSREVQEQIVSILDRFDALVNDLKCGLPAEIALRRKQYEFYRDKLLTFEPKPPF